MTQRTPKLPIRLSNLHEARALEVRIRSSAAAAVAALGELLDGEPLEAFRAMKFRRIGFDPLDPSAPANVMEQIHQTFSHLTSLRAVEHLLERHPEHAPFTINLGTVAGPNVTSADGAVEAETFVAITVRDNNKLRSDIERMRRSAARHRYVFYHADEDAGTVTDPDVVVIAVTL